MKLLKWSIFVALVALVMTGCMNERSSPTAAISAKLADESNSACGGFTNISDCERIRRAIDRLMQMDTYPSCQQAGLIANAIFNSTSGSFGFYSDATYRTDFNRPWPLPRNGQITAAGVPEVPVPPGGTPTVSGEQREGDRIYVNRQYLANYHSDAEDASVIAHEVQHFLGNDTADHQTGWAFSIGNSCNR